MKFIDLLAQPKAIAGQSIVKSKFIQDSHAIEPLLLRMPTVGNEERHLVVKILEFVIRDGDDIIETKCVLFKNSGIINSN